MGSITQAPSLGLGSVGSIFPPRLGLLFPDSKHKAARRLHCFSLGLGFRGLGFRGLGFGGLGLGFRVQGLGFRVQVFGLRV